MREELDDFGAPVFRNEREATDAGLNLLLGMVAGSWKELRASGKSASVVVQAA